MPVCPECTFWTPDFNLGEVDHNGTYVKSLYVVKFAQFRWFCNGCWQAWEDERKELRMSSGKLLPEDREMYEPNMRALLCFSSYASIRPIKLYDYEDDLTFKISLAEQFNSDLPWFKVDIESLAIETFCGSSDSGPAFLRSVDEKPKQTQVCEASFYKSLKWRQGGLSPNAYEEEFSMDFSVPYVVVGSEGGLLTSIFQLPNIYFPGKLVSETFEKFRMLARDARRFRIEEAERDRRRLAEKEEQRKKQQVELAQKQKDLVQLALRRAQKQKAAICSLSLAPPQPTNVWSSSAAVPVAPVGDPWSSQMRPMLPPAMPGWSSAMTAPPVTFHGVPNVARDPWAVEPCVEPEPKRTKTPPEAPWQRMARFGVPFRTNP